MNQQIWACVWMHKCDSGSYKLVLYSFTALPATGLPVQFPACCDVLTAGMTVTWLPQWGLTGPTNIAAPSVCIRMIFTCDDFCCLLHASFRLPGSLQMFDEITGAMNPWLFHSQPSHLCSNLRC